MRRKYTIPTILGFFIIALGIGAGVWLTTTKSFFQTSANPAIEPRGIRVTNITDGSFTVSWFTAEKTTGFVAYGKTKALGITTQQTQPSFIHHVTVNGLEPNTVYYFAVGSAGTIFNNKEEPYRVFTASKTKKNTAPQEISSKVVDKFGKPVQAIVYINMPGATPLSTVTQQDGSWQQDISQARTETLASYYQINTNTILDIFIQSKPGYTAWLKVRAGEAQFIPTIQIGQSKDYTKIKTQGVEKLPTAKINLPTKEQSRFTVPQESSPSGSITEKQVSLLWPADGEIVETSKPTLQGEGKPKLIIHLLITSAVLEEPIVTTVEIQEDGTWRWTPTNQLADGSYSLTITWEEGGREKSLTNSFKVKATQ